MSFDMQKNSYAYNVSKPLIKEVFFPFLLIYLFFFLFFFLGREGVQSDMENCEYLWKNPGVAPR